MWGNYSCIGESFPILYQTTEKIKIYSLEKYICAPCKDILVFLYATLPLGQETSDNATSIICVKLVSLSMAEVASPVTMESEMVRTARALTPAAAALA